VWNVNLKEYFLWVLHFKVLLLHCVTELMNVRELNFLKNNCNLPHLWFICNFFGMVKLLFYKF